MNGNGKLTETENTIYLRKLRNYYGILTDKSNSYVFLKRNTEILLRMNGNVTLETRHYWSYSVSNCSVTIAIKSRKNTCE